MDLVLESCLNAAWKELGFIGLRDTEITRDHGADLIGSAGPAEFADAFDDRAYVSGELRGLFFFEAVTVFPLTVCKSSTVLTSSVPRQLGLD